MREDREFSVSLDKLLSIALNGLLCFSRSHPDTHLQKPWSAAALSEEKKKTEQDGHFHTISSFLR